MNRKTASIPNLRALSPEGLIPSIKISNPLSNKHKSSLDHFPDLNNVQMTPTDSGNMSRSASEHRQTLKLGYTAYSQLIKSPHAKVSSAALMKQLALNSPVLEPLPPAEPVVESFGIKGKAAQKWAKGVRKREKMRVSCMQKGVKMRTDCKSIGTLFESFESMVALMLEVDWFARDGRLEAVSNMLYLERLLFLAIEEHLDLHSKAQYKESEKTASEEGIPPSKTALKTLRSMLPVSRIQSLDTETDGRMMVEVARLENHVELLADKLHEIQGLGTIEVLQKRLQSDRDAFQDQVAGLKKQLLGKDQLIASIQNQLGQTKEQLIASELKVKELLEFKARYTTKLQTSLDFNEKIENERCAFENRLQMLLEDCRRFSDLLEELKVLKENLRIVNTKFTKLEMDVLAGNIGFGGDAAAIVQLDDPVFKVILPSAYIEKVKKLKTPAQAAAYKGSLFTTGTDTNVDASGVDLQRFRQDKPSFATLVMDEIPVSKADIADMPYQLWLEVTIRGIYDSKYSEHLLCSEDSGRLKSFFPEFVYAWMGQYTIDEKKREVVQLDWSLKDQVDKRRYNLLLAVSTDKAKKAWEVWTFREFLLENLDLDQLSFFLHCRQLLFRGPQLHYNSGKYAVIHYVPIDHVNLVIDKLMAKLPITDRSAIKGMVLDKARDRSGVLHVDCSYVLRILLVYYEREKKSKFVVLEELFQLSPKTEIKRSHYLPFSGFKQICLNINQDLSDLEIVKLYRATWKVGNGEITAETMFTAANESNFLSNCLRLGNFWPKPQLDTYSDIEKGIDDLTDCYAASVKDWKEMNKRLEVMKEGVVHMGLLQVSNAIWKVENVLKRKGQLPSEETAGRHLSEVYIRLWWYYCQASLVHKELYGPIINTRDSKNYATKLFASIEDMKMSCVTFYSDLHAMKTAKFILKLSVNRIQRLWKEKRIQKRKHKKVIALEQPANL